MHADMTGQTGVSTTAAARKAPDPARKAALLYAWRCGLSPEEVELDLKWRAVFGCPLPILGDPKTVRRILAQSGVVTP